MPLVQRVVSAFWKVFVNLAVGHIAYRGALDVVDLGLSEDINVFCLRLVKCAMMDVRMLCIKTLLIVCC